MNHPFLSNASLCARLSFWVPNLAPSSDLDLVLIASRPFLGHTCTRSLLLTPNMLRFPHRQDTSRWQTVALMLSLLGRCSSSDEALLMYMSIKGRHEQSRQLNDFHITQHHDQSCSDLASSCHPCPQVTHPHACLSSTNPTQTLLFLTNFTKFFFLSHSFRVFFFRFVLTVCCVCVGFTCTFLSSFAIHPPRVC